MKLQKRSANWETFQFKTNYYIRFGEIPEGGKSGIFYVQPKPGENPLLYEKGVSCYEAAWSPDLKRWVISDDGDEQYLSTLDALLQDLESGQRKVYLLTGKEVGSGEDGEPVLDATTIKLIKELRPNDIYNEENYSFFDDYPPFEEDSISPEKLNIPWRANDAQLPEEIKYESLKEQANLREQEIAGLTGDERQKKVDEMFALMEEARRVWREEVIPKRIEKEKFRKQKSDF